jgi:hypothetical protein
MSIRSTLIVATAIATLGVQVGPAFAAEGFSPGTANKKPSYYSMADGKWHMGRPHHQHAHTAMQQNDWWWGQSHH